MIIQYQNLRIYHAAHAFVLKIYKLVEKFPSLEDNNLTSQLRRAATCLPLNIAEGSGANSPKIFLNYLIFAYRSSREVEAALLLAKDLHYLSDEEFNQIHTELTEFMKMLVGYMKYLETDYIGSNRKKDVTLFYRQQRENIGEEMGKFA